MNTRFSHADAVEAKKKKAYCVPNLTVYDLCIENAIICQSGTQEQSGFVFGDEFEDVDEEQY